MVSNIPNKNNLLIVKWFQIFLYNRNIFLTVVWFQVFLCNTSNLLTVIWFQVFLCNTNNLHTVIWFHVFLPYTNNFQSDRFDSSMGSLLTLQVKVNLEAVGMKGSLLHQFSNVIPRTPLFGWSRELLTLCRCYSRQSLSSTDRDDSTWRSIIIIFSESLYMII